MPSKLDQLKEMTTIVADSGDIDTIKAFKPTDCTTNPSLILKASGMGAYARFVDEAIVWGKSRGCGHKRRVRPHPRKFRRGIVEDRAWARVDGGRCGAIFRQRCHVGESAKLIADYEKRGVGRDRILIKLSSTWEGFQTAKVLQKEGIDCNMTLLFSLAQAAVAADVGAFLISPFVGRILDWHKKAEGKEFSAAEDPGVRSVQKIYAYYKKHGLKTVVMGASFRSTGEIEELAGCDRLTISPDLLKKLADDNGVVTRKLSPEMRDPDAPAKMSLDEKSFRWLMNEDQMATEKLSDGIRLFAADLRTLREVVSKKLEAAG